MFPWIYGFHWSTGPMIFMGALYVVLTIVAVTIVVAVLRSRRALADGKVEDIRWLSDFHDLPARDRVCRHVLKGELAERECANGFDCRKCETHAKLQAHPRTAQPDDLEEEICGMTFPLDRLYHRGHTWVHPEADGTVTVGLDELGARLIGTPETVDLPKVGARLRTNGTAFRLRKRNADVRVLSPVDGEVVRTGGARSGWYLRIKPVGGRFDLRHLLGAGEIRPWVMREMERLQLALSAEGAALPTLADGGVPVADIAASYPNADWDAVCGDMFLQP